MKPDSHRLIQLTLAGFLVALIATERGWAKDEIACPFVAQSIAIDGRYDDWKDNPGSFLEKQKAVVAVSNDHDNLYLLFRTNDPRWVRTIAMSGLTLYIDVDGGKRKDFYLKFVGGPSREQLRLLQKQEIGERPREKRRMPENMRRMELEDSPRDSVPTLFCYVKDQIDEKSIPLGGVEGPSAAFDTSRGFFVYEFAIPLKESAVRSYGLGTSLGEEISVGLIWGEPMPMRGERPREEMDFGGPGGGMGGGMTGGGMGGGMGRGMSGPPGGTDRPSKQEVWLKARLAKN